MECLTKLCVCLIFLIVAVHGVSAGLIKTCADDAACKVETTGDPNAVCAKAGTTGGDNDGKCICTGAFKNNSKNDGCVAKVITDNACTADAAGNTTCQGVDSNAMCPASPTKCACKAGYFLSTDKATCVQKITMVGCTPGTAGTAACKMVDANSECKTAGTMCTCKEGYTGTDSCTKDAGSSATSAWMTTSLIATSLLIYLPRLI